jgi:hypothetical protein
MLACRLCSLFSLLSWYATFRLFHDPSSPYSVSPRRINRDRRDRHPLRTVLHRRQETRPEECQLASLVHTLGLRIPLWIFERVDCPPPRRAPWLIRTQRENQVLGFGGAGVTVSQLAFLRHLGSV